MRFLSPFVLIAAAIAFIVGGESGDVAAVLIGAGLGVLGVYLYDRGLRRDLESRPPQPPVIVQPQPLQLPGESADRLARLEELLLGMQSDIDRLREDREFFEKLYGGGREVPR